MQSVPISVDLEQPEQGSGGESWQCVQTLLELPGSGEQYLLLQIDIWEPRSMTDGDGEPVPPIARLELMDGNTGETLIDDLSAAYESALREIWGGSAEAEAPLTEVREGEEEAGTAIS